MKNALIGLFAAFAVLSSLAEVTRDTEWYKIPDKTKVGDVVDLSDTSLKADKSALDSHVVDTNNPHAVTAAQVGAYTKDEVNTKLDAKADKETTLAGYGITDALPLVEDNSGKKTAVTLGTRSSKGTVGRFSLANGESVIAQGNSSHAEGAVTTASGYSSHAEGFNSTASGNYSHAEGYYSTASGNYSHAEGYNSTASGKTSHAEGYNSTASGNYSHAEGYNATTRDYDIYAFAWNGDGDRTNSYYSHGPGTFNINPEGGLDGFFIGEQTLSDVIKDSMNVELDPKKWVDTNDTVVVKSHAMITYSPTFVDNPPEKLLINADGTRNFEIYFPDNDSVRELLPIDFDVVIEGDVKKIGKVWTEKITKLPAILTIREPEDKTLLATVQYFD